MADLAHAATATVYWPLLIKEWWTEPIDVDRNVTYVVRSDRVGSCSQAPASHWALPLCWRSRASCRRCCSA
jgi:hypothetical protein